MNILIITGGSIDRDFAEGYLKKNSYQKIIAADAGLQACDQLHLCPTEILGDFDSLKDASLIEKYQARHIPLKKFPTRKDYSDTHLAAAWALDLLEEEESEARREARVTILGGLGTRMDHSLANIGLLKQFADREVRAVIVNERNKIEMLKGPCTRFCAKEDRYPFFSLLAVSERVKGLTLEGFDYPLRDAVLDYGVSRGVSNRIAASRARLRLEAGYLLMIYSAD